MNRLVLIGNGFDLAHGLKTSYKDFICWYWEQRVRGFFGNLTSVSKDPLCRFEIYQTNTITCWNAFAFQCQELYHKKQYNEIIQSIFVQPSQYKVIMSSFFTNIIKIVKTKGWVDIENEYYDLLKKYALEEDGESKVDELNEQLLGEIDKLK